MEGVEYPGVIRASCVYTVSPRLNKSISKRRMWLDEIAVTNFYSSIFLDTLSWIFEDFFKKHHLIREHV